MTKRATLAKPYVFVVYSEYCGRGKSGFADQMATEEHKRLADIVKGTHALLRAECHQYGAEIAWERHLARNDVLQVRFKPALFKIEIEIEN